MVYLAKPHIADSRGEGTVSERRVIYFDTHGEQNTGDVIECVRRRIEAADVTTVIVATSTGKTALAFAESLAGTPGLRLLAVGNPPGSTYERITPENRRKLADLGVMIVDYAPYGLASLQGDAHRNLYGALDLLVVVADIWRMMGGQGFKVAMEVGLMATNVGVLPTGSTVIAVGGTASGADTAVVMRTAYSTDVFSDDTARRPELLEFICTPLPKKWW
jgi:uncharacterized protein